MLNIETEWQALFSTGTGSPTALLEHKTVTHATYQSWRLLYKVKVVRYQYKQLNFIQVMHKNDRYGQYFAVNEFLKPRSVVIYVQRSQVLIWYCKRFQINLITDNIWQVCPAKRIFLNIITVLACTAHNLSHKSQTHLFNTICLSITIKLWKQQSHCRKKRISLCKQTHSQ